LKKKFSTFSNYDLPKTTITRKNNKTNKQQQQQQNIQYKENLRVRG